MPNILLIDDSAFMRKIVREFLEEGGFEVTDFLPQSALELMGKVKDSKPDLVLSDFNMPCVGGLEVARIVRRVSAAIPVIILTATHDTAMESLLKTTGVRRILHKPIGGEQLVAAVLEVMSIT